MVIYNDDDVILLLNKHVLTSNAKHFDNYYLFIRSCQLCYITYK